MAQARSSRVTAPPQAPTLDKAAPRTDRIPTSLEFRLHTIDFVGATRSRIRPEGLPTATTAEVVAAPSTSRIMALRCAGLARLGPAAHNRPRSRRMINSLGPLVLSSSIRGTRKLIIGWSDSSRAIRVGRLPPAGARARAGWSWGWQVSGASTGANAAGRSGRPEVSAGQPAKSAPRITLAE